MSDGIIIDETDNLTLSRIEPHVASGTDVGSRAADLLDRQFAELGEHGSRAGPLVSSNDYDLVGRRRLSLDRSEALGEHMRAVAGHDHDSDTAP